MVPININIIGSSADPSKDEKFQELIKNKPDVVIVGTSSKKKSWWARCVGLLKEENDVADI